ncbi:39S ribosomal protein L52, mitochondrial [Sergentomyia squamirostris]
MNKILSNRMTPSLPLTMQFRQKYELHEKSVLKPRENKDSHRCKLFKVNPTKFGPLTNLPDYTFMDGRPTPLGSRQRSRLEEQRVIATKIVSLNKELAFAKERYQRMMQENAIERKRILDGKLKEKGREGY